MKKLTPQDLQDARDFRTIVTMGLELGAPIGSDPTDGWCARDSRTGNEYYGRTLHEAIEAARQGQRA